MITNIYKMKNKFKSNSQQIVYKLLINNNKVHNPSELAKLIISNKIFNLIIKMINNKK